MIYPDSFEHKIGFDSVRHLVVDACLTIPGREMAHDMTFSPDAQEVKRRLTLTAEMHDLVKEEGSAFPLEELGDIEEVLARIRVAGASMTVDDLVALTRMMQVSAALVKYFATRRDEEGRSRVPALNLEASELDTFTELLRLSDRTIDRFGNVRDSASPELADIRGRLRSLQGSLAAIMRRVMARAVQQGLIEEGAAPAMRDGRLVMPVNPANKRKVNGIVHDESASGKTVYIEPAEVVEAGNRLRELQAEELREIARIMAIVAAEFRESEPELAGSYADIGRLDFIHAKAVVAAETDGVLPSVSDAPELEWYHACHPELARSLRRKGREIVPLDITMAPGQRILVISGPNAGGKSVCLKTVGCLQYMLQCGMLPPVYDTSHFGVFQDIMVDIGDDQSIENDLSTFSSHLRSMKLFLTKGRAGSLMLIDEFGGGTEPQIGGALAQAMLSRFNEQKMWGVVTTHYHNLKQLASETPGLVNGSMLYDRQQMQPLFKLSVGTPGSSFALEIARKTGLPAEVIDSAKEIVGSDYVNYDKYLLDISRDKRYWEQKRLEIKRKEKELEDVLGRYRDEADSLRRQRREILDEARTEARKMLDGSNAAIERAISDIRKAQAEREATLEARRKLDEAKRSTADSRRSKSIANNNELLRKAPKTKNDSKAVKTPKAENAQLEVGDVVKLDGQTTPGRILELSGGKAQVAFGVIKTWVPLTRLRRSGATIKSGADAKASFISAATTDAMRRKQLNFRQEIDVRGMRADEALQAVTYFIDEAIQFGAERVTILHGTGTGALRQAIRQYLGAIPSVKSAHDEDVRLGGAGITVVELV